MRFSASILQHRCLISFPPKIVQFELNKRPSLLKNSIVELYEEEKRRKILSNNLKFVQFCQQKMVFRILKNSSVEFFNRLGLLLRLSNQATK